MHLSRNFKASSIHHQTFSSMPNTDVGGNPITASFRQFSVPRFVSVETWTRDYEFEFCRNVEAPVNYMDEALYTFQSQHVVTTYQFVTRLQKYIHLSFLFPLWTCLTENEHTYFFMKTDDEMGADPANADVTIFARYIFMFNKHGAKQSQMFHPEHATLKLFVKYEIDCDRFSIDNVRTGFQMYGDDADGYA